MRRVFAPVVLGAALLAAAALPAVATTVDEHGKIAADCSGFTLTFYGQGFDADDDQTFIEWTVFLRRAQDPAAITYTGSLTLSFGADGGASPRKSIRIPWDVDVCGENTVVSGGEAPAGYTWTNEAGNGSRGAFLFNYDAYMNEVPRPAPEITALLACSCDDTVEICRSPGFWGTHGGTEKRKSRNVTQAVLDAAGGVEVCGTPIYQTIVGSRNSALEAICVSPEGDRRLQLARQLAAAALNCVVSGGGPTCEGLPIAETFNACNDACLDLGGRGDRGALRDCIDALACFNDGGALLDNGMCQVGTCNGDGVTACSDDRSCEELSGARCGGGSGTEGPKCVRTPGNCHDRPLVNEELGLFFDPEGPAGSPKACHDATRNRVTIFDGGSESGGHGHGGGCRH